MPRSKVRQRRRKEPHQIYDSTFKEWVQKQPEQILPLLLKGATYLETLDIERIRPTLRADRVYKAMYRDVPHILHMEFESGSDNDMASRLLVYHAILYRDYHLPIISIIVYVFPVVMATSPGEEMTGNEVILTLKFEVLPLFSLDAEYYVREHLTCMYPLLPTMHGVSRQLIEQATEELAELYREDEVSLAQQLIWMELLLERAEVLPPEEKLEVQRSLSMYDPLWENHPKVKKIKAQARAEVRQARETAREEARQEAQREIERAKAEAEQKVKREVEQLSLQMLRGTFVMIVKARFPRLAEQARKKAAEIDKVDALNLLIEQISTLEDEKLVSLLLRLSADK